MTTLRRAEVPAAYRMPAAPDQQGAVVEVSYPVNNYIDSQRRFATDHSVDPREAGRAAVRGEAIAKSCNVYLPSGYDESDADTRYPVVYLLHGVGGDQNEWLHGSGTEDGRSILCNVLDHLIAGGDIDPVIVVMPNGRSSHDWTDRSFTPDGTNLLGFYYFDYELRFDLIPFIERSFKTRANIRDISPEAVEYNRMHRAVAGLSMGGMQALNLIIGGYRCDSAADVGEESRWSNGLVETVPAPGMTDLFAYVGSFSNAPTSSDGKWLGASIAANGHKLRLLYMTCGDADNVSYRCYEQSFEGLEESAGSNIDRVVRVTVQDGVHDFNVWNDGAYHFIRQAFGRRATT